jgi:KDO2-lipid IV(A) lauroyltransferase
MELSRIPRRAEDAAQLLTLSESAELELVKQAARTGPLVVAASHYGAYEVLGMLSPLMDMPATTLVRPLDNPLLETYLKGIRTRFGQRIVGNRGGLRSLIRDLEDGRNAVVLVDLNHRAAQRIFVDYFGTPAATAPTAARLAVRTGRPLVCVFARRLERPMRFELDFGALHWPRSEGNREDEVVRLMQCVTSDVEERVRREPGHWLWTHRRWKTRPAPDGSAGSE